MEPIIFFLGASCGFCFGYIFGFRDLKFQNLLESLSNFKESLIDKFTPRQKVVILNSKDELPEKKEDPY